MKVRLLLAPPCTDGLLHDSSMICYHTRNCLAALPTCVHCNATMSSLQCPPPPGPPPPNLPPVPPPNQDHQSNIMQLQGNEYPLYLSSSSLNRHRLALSITVMSCTVPAKRCIQSCIRKPVSSTHPAPVLRKDGLRSYAASNHK